MRFTLKKDKSGVVIVGVEGQLIVGNRQELKQKVLDALEEGSRKFVIDFSKTGYIDSSGLGVLVSLSKKIREQGGELRLAGHAWGRCGILGRLDDGPEDLVPSSFDVASATPSTKRRAHSSGGGM